MLSSVKKLVITAICAAFCVALPLAFHWIPNAGTILLPMHIPVLLCGLICGWPYGMVCGLIGPLLSSFTGMPPLAILPSMMVECATYGLVTGLMMRFVRTGKYAADERIPSVREYAAIVEVNANTVMRTYELLQNQNIIYNRRGIGFFVAPDAKENILRIKQESILNNEINDFFAQLHILGIDCNKLVELYNIYLNNLNTESK